MWQDPVERNKKADHLGQPLSDSINDEKSSDMYVFDLLLAAIRVRVGEKGLEPLTSSV